MEFQFAIYTEVTELAHRVNPEYKNSGYTRIFVCPDTHVFHLCRVLPDTNSEYQKMPGNHLIERNQIDRERNSNFSVNTIRRLLIEDDFSNWDFVEGKDIEEMIDECIDAGFGILNRTQSA